MRRLFAVAVPILLGVLPVADAQVIRIHVAACNASLADESQRVLTKNIGRYVQSYFWEHFHEPLEWSDDCASHEAQYDFRLIGGRDRSKRYHQTLVYIRGDQQHSAIVVRYDFAHRLAKQSKCPEEKLVGAGIAASIVLHMADLASRNVLHWIQGIDLLFIRRDIPQTFMDAEVLKNAGLQQ